MARELHLQSDTTSMGRYPCTVEDRLEKNSVETNGVEPAPMEAGDIDDVENVDEVPSSLDFHEHET